MKKVILIAAIALVCMGANAQEAIKTEAGTFTKPIGGTTIMEVTLTPDLTGGGIFSLPTLNSDLGMIGLKARHFTSEKRAYRLTANVSISDSGEDNVDTEWAAGIAYGIEYHRAGAERLSTYWGYEGNLGYVTINDDTWGGQTKKCGVGANLFTGFDYYVMPKIYLGAEVGYGLAVTSTNPEWGDTVTRIQLSPNITPSFRLGWQF